MDAKNILKLIKKYFKFWWFSTTVATQIAFTSRFGAITFVIGKILRFAFFLLFILILDSKTQTIAGYNLWQLIFFYATFNLIDTLPQFFLRAVYRFRFIVVEGHFDYFLTKPISPLFRSLFGGSDILDLSMLLLSGGFIIYSATHLNAITPVGVIAYLILLVNAFVISLAFHIVTIASGILTTEVDNAIMLYRDATQMGRIPIDVYREPISWIITFVIPIGIMMTFPAKALMGLLSLQTIIIAIVISSLFLLGSLKLWSHALKNYTSVSS